MHTFGKILIWLTIPAAIAAVVFMSRMIQVRNEWTKKVAALEADNEATEKNLADLRKEVADSTRELDILSFAWNQYWNDINVGALPANNTTVNAALGKAETKHADNAELPVLQAFEIGPDGTLYIGPFLATKMEDNRTEFTPTWKVRGGDVERWNRPGAKWRWRAIIPSPYTEQFVELQDRLIRADQILGDRNKNLEIQNSLLAAAQQRLKGNLQMLGADPEKPETTGLVDAVAAEEETRNATVNELDRLRRAMSAEYKRRNVLADDNRRLMRRLPQPTKTEPQQKAGVAAKISETN